MIPSDFDSDAMADPYDWDALARYVAGESTPAEQRVVEAWLAARPERARLAEPAPVVVALASPARRLATARLAERATPGSRRWRVIGSLAAAAAVVVTAIGMWNNRQHSGV